MRSRVFGHNINKESQTSTSGRWMKEWRKKREQYSHVILLREIADTETEDYKNYFRMDENTFDKLLDLVSPFLNRESTNMRQCISVKERLAVTLTYLATGRSFEDMKFSAIMSPSSLSTAVIETCEVIIRVLHDYIKVSCSYFTSPGSSLVRIILTWHMRNLNVILN